MAQQVQALKFEIDQLEQQVGWLVVMMIILAKCVHPSPSFKVAVCPVWDACS